MSLLSIDSIFNYGFKTISIIRYIFSILPSIECHVLVLPILLAETENIIWTEKGEEVFVCICYV